MNPSTTVVRLAALIAALTLVAAGAGLLWGGGDGPFEFTTLRGETVAIDGHGLYRYDTPLIALGFRVTDAVTIVLCTPVLLLAARGYRRGSLRAGIVLAGALAYFLYTYASMALGAAYNSMFLVYLVILAASLFGLMLTVRSIDADQLPAHFSSRLPRRAIATFLTVAGIALLAIWLFLSIIPALLQGAAPPELQSYTTVITFVVDMAIVAPALIVAGALLRRAAPLGYLLAATLLVFTVLLGVSLLAAGVAQALAGLMHMGQFIGFTASFAVLTLAACWLTAALLRDLSERAPLPLQAAHG